MDVLLASAVNYALKAAALVAPGDLPRPTPCAEWDVERLLRHLCASMAVVDEAITGGRTPASGTTGDPVEVLRDRAAALLCDWFEAGDRMVEVGGLQVPSALIAAAGAMEIAVHGWDLSVACGQRRPIPVTLAGPLIRLLPMLVSVRDGLFDEPFAVLPCASPGYRLVAYLGRDPRAWQRVTRE